MATYVIGDIHGCWNTLQRLLDRIGWNPVQDELWLVGDLVNRGPRSLEVLRWASGQRRLVATLGNHDLHLLALAAGVAEARQEDSLEDVLGAVDRDSLLEWLQRQPFVHRSGDLMMVHAGLLPDWDENEVADLAAQSSERLSGGDGRCLLERLGAKPRPRWRAGLEGDERLAAAVALFTRVRVVGPDGQPRLGYTGPPGRAPAGCRPWFESSRVVESSVRIVFGHWAQLGLHGSGRVLCLDSGCVYGGCLTAWCAQDGRVFSEPLADPLPHVEE